MPRSNGSFKTPSYCLHKRSGHAYVTLGGREVWLGRHGSPESRDAYDRALAEWLAAGRNQTRSRSYAPVPTGLTVSGVVAAFWEHAKGYYGSPAPIIPQVRPHGELGNFWDILKLRRRLYGPTPAAAFGPRALKALRAEMIRRGWCRTYVNRQAARVRQVFRWAACEELVAASVYHALTAVAGLRRGAAGVRDSAPVRPVGDATVDATLPHLAPQVRAMVELQRITGMRSSELCLMRRCDIDERSHVWTYRPPRHKTAHHGHDRVVYLGERCQRILEPFLTSNVGAYLFSPAEAAETQRASRAPRRGTPDRCGRSAGRRKRRRHRIREPRDRYTKHSYRRAIVRACDRAFTPPPELVRQRVPARGRKGKAATRWETPAEWRARLGKDGAAKLATWLETHRWHPHQLRHAAATRWRAKHGPEVALVLLGDRNSRMLDLYAEKNTRAAMEAMTRVG